MSFPPVPPLPTPPPNWTNVEADAAYIVALITFILVIASGVLMQIGAIPLPGTWNTTVTQWAGFVTSALGLLSIIGAVISKHVVQAKRDQLSADIWHHQQDTYERQLELPQAV